MYQFNIVKERDGGVRFELDGINLILDGYSIKDGKHYLMNPERAIAFFNLNGSMYSVSNNIGQYTNAEDLYDSIRKQYILFRKSENADLGTNNDKVNKDYIPSN